MTFKKTLRGTLKRALKGTAWFILSYAILWVTIAFIRFDLGIDVFPTGHEDGEGGARFSILFAWFVFVEYHISNRGRL